MTILHGKSKGRGMNLVKDRLAKLRKHYGSEERERNGEKGTVLDMNIHEIQRLGKTESAPVKIKTKTGRIIYFHPVIRVKQIKIYEKLYVYFEDLVKSGDFPYNPLAKMYFKKGVDGRHFAIATHAGETLSGLDYKVKNPIEIARDFINIRDLIYDCGYCHGHLHGGNICIDSEGRVKIIDISKFDSIDKYSPSGRSLEIMHLTNVLNGLVLEEHHCLARSHNSPEEMLILIAKKFDLPESKKQKIIEQYKNLLLKIKGIHENESNYYVNMFKCWFYSADKILFN